jgi:hypothetical protein
LAKNFFDFFDCWKKIWRKNWENVWSKIFLVKNVLPENIFGEILAQIFWQKNSGIKFWR